MLICGLSFLSFFLSDRFIQIIWMHVQYMFIPTAGSQKSKNMESSVDKKLKTPRNMLMFWWLGKFHGWDDFQNLLVIVILWL